MAHARKTPLLGQHFLTRPEIAGWVADSAHLSPHSTVLEIGPGHGILTRELLNRATRVVAIEKDPALVLELHDVFHTEVALGNLAIIEEDVRVFDTNTFATTPYAVVANIPYYLTGRIIRTFLTAPHQPTSMTLLVQKEVAERIVAKNGKESLLSLSVKAYGVPEYIRTVKAGSFSPPPKIDSAILSIRDISRKCFLDAHHEDVFFTLIHAGFASKRKTLGNTLREHIQNGLVLPTALAKNTRPEDVSIACWLDIAFSNRERCHP